MSETPAGIDPRGPRVAASITTVILALALFLALIGVSGRAGEVPLLARILDPGFLVLLGAALLFAWGVASPRTAPWGALFRAVIRPRLAPPVDLEDPRPPRFAQGVGLLVSTVGLVLHLLGVPWALPIAAGAALVAAFLNAAFGVCLGCLLYLGLQRAGLLGRGAAA